MQPFLKKGSFSNPTNSLLTPTIIFAVICFSAGSDATTEKDSTESHGHDSSSWHSKQSDKVKSMPEEMQERLKLCESLFHVENYAQHFRSCAAEVAKRAHSESVEEDTRRKRRAVTGDIPYFEGEPDPCVDMEAGKNEIDYEGSNVHASRPRRDAGGHGHKKLGSKGRRKNPCIYSCALDKLGMVNSSGDLQVELVLTRMGEILTAVNTTNSNKVASGIVNDCIAQQKDTPKSEKSGVVDLLRCKSVMRLGSCLHHDLIAVCFPEKGLASNGNTFPAL